MVDQTLIPYESKKVDIKTTEQMYNAIKTMIVRGAPAIGISGAHGAALCAIELLEKNEKNFTEELKKGIEYINSRLYTLRRLYTTLHKLPDNSVSALRRAAFSRRGGGASRKITVV